MNRSERTAARLASQLARLPSGIGLRIAPSPASRLLVWHQIRRRSGLAAQVALVELRGEASLLEEVGEGRGAVLTLADSGPRSALARLVAEMPVECALVANVRPEQAPGSLVIQSGADRAQATRATFEAVRHLRQGGVVTFSDAASAGANLVAEIASVSTFHAVVSWQWRTLPVVVEVERSSSSPPKT